MPGAISLDRGARILYHVQPHRRTSRASVSWFWPVRGLIDQKAPVFDTFSRERQEHWRSTARYGHGRKSIGKVKVLADKAPCEGVGMAWDDLSTLKPAFVRCFCCSGRIWPCSCHSLEKVAKTGAFWSIRPMTGQNHDTLAREVWRWDCKKVIYIPFVTEGCAL